MKPLVSILIPAYNAEEFIADTLRSAQAQTWLDKEIIVVDDGSADQTLAIARRFESKEVKVVTQANQGAAAARNTAFSLCQGDYIQWLDADDLLSPDKVERQMVAARNDRRTLLSCAWGRFLYRPAHAQFLPSALWCDLTPVEWLLRKMAGNLHMQTATWLVSRELSEAAGPWNVLLKSDDDGEYFCRVLLASDDVRFVPEARVYYRMAGFSRLSYIGYSEPKMVAQLESMKRHIGYLRSLEDSGRVRAACLNYLRTWSPHFYPERMDLFGAAQQMAAELGGQLAMPKTSWKYAWIQALLGWRAAKRVQLHYNEVKWSLLRQWDKMLFQLEGREALLPAVPQHRG
jgi:glycosyltransferase involved in cell wall biosynthesis